MSSLLSQLSSPIFQLVVILSLLLVCGQLYVCILSLRQGRGAGYQALLLLHLALDLFCFMLVSHIGHVPSASTFGPTPSFVTALCSLPWLLCLSVELLSAALLAFWVVDSLLWRRHRLSPNAIKEALDLLPAAVCFMREDGTVLLADLQMTALCRELTGQMLTDGRAFWDTASALAEPQGEQLLLRRGDRVLLLDRQSLQVDGEPILQLTAVDVSERIRVSEELRRNNERLRALGQRMRAYQAQKADVLLSEELLATQVFLHDQLGHALLQARYYLEQPERVDVPDLLRSLRLVNAALLREQEDLSLQGDPCETAFAMARAIGVEVRVVEGELPTERRLRLLLGQAVRECAANTVKHAGGDLLELRIRRDAGSWQLSLENNGRPPAGQIREAGGLLSLRRMTVSAGGEMQLQSHPRACVTLDLPTGAENSDI